jgi:predicted nucleotidyltransferase
MTPDFSQLIARLTDAGFDFVIMGGFAAVTHGSSQVTRDLDVGAVLTEETVGLLRRTLAEWHPRHRLTTQRLSFLTFPAPGEPVANLSLETDLGVIDILSSVLGVGGYERLKSRAEELTVDGRTCRVISLEDLIAAKEAIGHDKDRLTAVEIRVIARKRTRPQS